MYCYNVVLLSVSKQSLNQAVYALQSSMVFSYKYQKFLKKKFPYSPLLELNSLSFKQIRRFPIKKKHFSVIKSPFVYKKSGESFVFTYYKASFTLNLTTRYVLRDFQVRGVFSFLLKNQKVPLIFSNVELRIMSVDSSHGIAKKL
jgi:hypothetical protein